MPESPDVSEWAKLPKKMQHQFFELAELQAGKTKTRMLKDFANLQKWREKLKFSDMPQNDEWRNWRVCVVDGTETPVMSERIGERFGAYGATYHIYQDMALVEEDYFSGQLVDLQIGDSVASQKILSLLTVALERDVALKCLKKNIDLLLVDGSARFFGFRPNCHPIHKREVPNEQFRNGALLVEHIRDATIKLLETRKAVGIIKRVQTVALDGWAIHKNCNLPLLHRNDRHLLASLMKEKQYFSYEDCFENPVVFNYYTRLALTYDRYKQDRNRNIDSIFKVCMDDVNRSVKKNLLCEPQQIFTTSRHFARCSQGALPFCIETPMNFPLDNLLAYFQATANKATGLPIALDLTDQDITMPAGFTKELVEEIEANLLKDPNTDKFEIENHFASLNPQKNE